MFVEIEAVRSRFAELAGEACLELFDAYGVALDRRLGLSGANEPYFFSIISFVGHNIRGSCSLAASSEPLRSSLHCGDDLRDWIGELSNQLVGRVKSKLAALDVDIVITTPAVLRNARPDLLPMSEPGGACVFASKGGNAVVWLEVEVCPDFAFGIGTTEGTGREGEVLLF